MKPKKGAVSWLLILAGCGLEGQRSARRALLLEVRVTSNLETEGAGQKAEERSRNPAKRFQPLRSRVLTRRAWTAALRYGPVLWSVTLPRPRCVYRPHDLGAA